MPGHKASEARREITAQMQERADKIDDAAYFIAFYNCILLATSVGSKQRESDSKSPVSRLLSLSSQTPILC